jgi:hypothetical protein
MRHILVVAVAFSVAGGAAVAQTATETTTAQQTTVAPAPGVVAPVAPPVGTLSTTRTTHVEDAYGNQQSSRATSYRDSNGVAQDKQTTTTTVAVPPPPPPVTTTTTTESTTSGPQ